MSVQSSVPSVPSIKTLTSEEVAAIAPGTKVWVKFRGKGINEPCYFSGWNESGIGRLTGVGKDGLSQPIERSDIEAGRAQFSLIA
jgi:hypothetical protein